MWYNRDVIIDIGCSDFERARLNREIISKKLYICAYVRVENALAGLSFSGNLPYWMPQNSLQQMGGKARAEKLTPERRKEIARKAAEVRWHSL